MFTKKEFEEELNKQGTPEEVIKNNCGRVPCYTATYGTWLRRNDPKTFNVAFQDRVREDWGKKK